MIIITMIMIVRNIEIITVDVRSSQYDIQEHL